HERAVRAVVEDDVAAQQEAGRRHRDRQDDPVRDVQDVEHYHHERRQQQVRQHGGEEVEDAARDARLRIRGDIALPTVGAGVGGGHEGLWDVGSRTYIGRYASRAYPPRLVFT